MTPSLYVRFSVLSGPISDRHFHDFEVLSGSAEQEIEIAEWIEFTEITAACGDLAIIIDP